MSNSESDNSYLIERFLLSDISRFKHNFLIGLWDTIIVRSNSDPSNPKTYDKNDGNKISVFSLKERLIRLFKRDIHYEIYKINLGKIKFPIEKKFNSKIIKLKIEVSVIENFKDIKTLNPVQKKQNKILEIQDFILDKLSITSKMLEQELLDKRYDIVNINEAKSQLISKKYIKINNTYYDKGKFFPTNKPSMPRPDYYLPQLMQISPNQGNIYSQDLSDIWREEISSQIIEPVLSKHTEDEIIKSEINTKCKEYLDLFLKKYALKFDHVTTSVYALDKNEKEYEDKKTNLLNQKNQKPKSKINRLLFGIIYLTARTISLLTPLYKRHPKTSWIITILIVIVIFGSLLPGVVDENNNQAEVSTGSEKTESKDNSNQNQVSTGSEKTESKDNSNQNQVSTESEKTESKDNNNQAEVSTASEKTESKDNSNQNQVSTGSTQANKSTSISFSWLSGGPTIDEYIHIPEGESLGYSQIKVHGSVSVDDPLIIDWGDGNTDSVKLQPGSREFTLPNHTYARNGEYEVNIQGTDTDENYGVFDFKVIVVNAVPTIENVIKPLISLDIETEIELQLGNTYLDSHFVIISWGDDSPISNYSLAPGENTLSLKHTYSVDTKGQPYDLQIEVSDQLGQKSYTQETLWFAESFKERKGPKDEYSIAVLEKMKLTAMSTYISARNSSQSADISLNDSQIFSLESSPSGLYSRVGIFDFPSQTWSYPFTAITPYRLFRPALYVLDNGEVLITGGIKVIKTEGHYNELSFIYDPISQTLSSIENNPVPEKFISAGGGQMWVEDAPGVDKIGPGSYGRGIHSYLLATERGDILFFQISPELPDVILATAFDSKSKSYKPVRGDTKVTSFNIKSCGVDDKPILLNDGRIFLQSAIISSDLSNVIQIDPPNIEGKKCFHTSYHFGGYGSISLPNSNVLFLSDKHSFIFDGDKYRDTKYQPPQFTGNGTRPTMYHDWDYEEQRRRIIIMPGSELTVLRIEFVY